MSFLICGFLSI